jgi:hypothetical protein
MACVDAACGCASPCSSGDERSHPSGASSLQATLHSSGDHPAMKSAHSPVTWLASDGLSVPPRRSSGKVTEFPNAHDATTRRHACGPYAPLLRDWTPVRGGGATAAAKAGTPAASATLAAMASAAGAGRSAPCHGCVCLAQRLRNAARREPSTTAQSSAPRPAPKAT